MGAFFFFFSVCSIAAIVDTSMIIVIIRSSLVTEVSTGRHMEVEFITAHIDKNIIALLVYNYWT